MFFGQKLLNIQVFEGNAFFDTMTFNTLTLWLIDFKNIDFWCIDKLHLWLFDILTKESYDLLQGSLLFMGL